MYKNWLTNRITKGLWFILLCVLALQVFGINTHSALAAQLSTNGALYNKHDPWQKTWTTPTGSITRVHFIGAAYEYDFSEFYYYQNGSWVQGASHYGSGSWDEWIDIPVTTQIQTRYSYDNDNWIGYVDIPEVEIIPWATTSMSLPFTISHSWATRNNQVATVASGVVWRKVGTDSWQSLGSPASGIANVAIDNTGGIWASNNITVYYYNGSWQNRGNPPTGASVLLSGLNGEIYSGKTQLSRYAGSSSWQQLGNLHHSGSAITVKNGIVAANGHIWISTSNPASVYDSLVYEWNGSSWVYRQTDQYVQSWAENSSGMIYMGRNNGFGTGKVTRWNGSDFEDLFVPNTRPVSSLAVAPDDSVWLVTTKGYDNNPTGKVYRYYGSGWEDTGLTTNNGYILFYAPTETVWAMLDGGSGLREIKFQPTTVDVSTSNPTQDSVTLSVSTDGLGIYYRVERSLDQFLWTPVTTTKVIPYVVSGLNAGTNYYFRVRSYDWISPAVSALTIPATPPAPGGAISGLSWSNTDGRGRVQLSWQAQTEAAGYNVWVYDGYAYRAFDVGNVTIWDSQVAKIYPAESTLDGYANNSQTGDLFNRIQGGLDLRDIPNKLYLKTSGTSYDANNNYAFRVSAYNASGESPKSNAYSPVLPNRTDTMPPTGSLSINDGMAKTDSTSVTLTISGSDPAVANYSPDTSDDASGVARMSFSNDNVSWTPWENFTTSKSWTIQSGPGSKNVYMKLNDVAGNESNLISSSIYLADDTKAPEISLSINQGAETTTSNLVDLLINATDDLTSIDQLQMRLSNNGTIWTSWTPFATAYNDWNIISGYGSTSGDGYKTVYLQVMDSMGNVNTTSDKIGYSTTLPTGSVSSTSGTSGTVQVGGSSIPVVFTKSAQVTANLTQSGATKVRYSMEGITWSPWEDVGTSRVLTFPAGEGIETAYVQYQNAYGLTSAVTQQTFVVDITPPTVRVSTVTGATATRTNNVNLLVDAQDNISTTGFAYQYSLNGGAWQNATLTNGQITVTGLSAVNTLYNISVKVTDQAGNAGIGTINLWRLP